MGLFKDDAGKTEDATAGRLAEAANKGNVPISKEFTTAGALLMAIVTLTSGTHGRENRRRNAPTVFSTTAR